MQPRRRVLLHHEDARLGPAPADAPSSGAVAAADTPKTDYAWSFFSDDVFSFGPVMRPPALPGPAPFRATDNGVLVGGPGKAAWMVGGTGNDTHAGDTAAAAAAAQWGGNRVVLFFGHQAAERPDEGRGAVRAGVDFAPPGRLEAPVLAAGTRTEVGNAVLNVLVGGGGDDFVAGMGGGGDTCRLEVRGDRGGWGSSGIAEAWPPPRWT